MFDWDRFKNGKIAVHCDTEEKANDFLKECNKQGITWTDGDKTTEINCWFWYEKDTSYACRDGKSKLTFEFLKHYKGKGLEIIKWEIDKMKELTFKEVIANIKEGEVWESAYSIVSKLENRINIEVSGNCKSIGIGDTVKFKLRRKEYTFEEAFKALEEGEEIESVISAYRIKKLTDGRFRISQKSQEFYTEKEGEVIITLQEIQGGWYIND